MSEPIAHPGTPLRGDTAIPRDKSCSHRALILAAMAEGTSEIANLGESDDVLRTVAAIHAFGIEVERIGPQKWQVRGGRWTTLDVPFDCSNSSPISWDRCALLERRSDKYQQLFCARVVEAMVALVLDNHKLLHRGQCGEGLAGQ